MDVSGLKSPAKVNDVSAFTICEAEPASRFCIELEGSAAFPAMPWAVIHQVNAVTFFLPITVKPFMAVKLFSLSENHFLHVLAEEPTLDLVIGQRSATAIVF